MMSGGPGRTPARLAAAAAALLALAGCAGPLGSGSDTPAPASMKVGGARPSGRHVLVLQPTGCFDRCASEYTRPTQWPEACKLFGQDEIRAVLPDASDISPSPHDQDIQVTGPNQLRGSRLGIATRSECIVLLALPDHPHVFVTVKDVAVGGLDAVRANYQDHLKSARGSGGQNPVAVRTDLGATECFTGEVVPAPGSHVSTPTPYDDLWHLDATWDCYRSGQYATIEFTVEGPQLDAGPGQASFTRGHTTKVAHDPVTARGLMADMVTTELVRTVSAAIA
jgi:hypothetical protein